MSLLDKLSGATQPTYLDEDPEELQQRGLNRLQNMKFEDVFDTKVPATSATTPGPSQPVAPQSATELIQSAATPTVPDAAAEAQAQQEPERLNLIEKIKRGGGDIATGFVSELSSAPYRTLKGLKQWMDYEAKEYAKKNPAQTAALISESQRGKTKDQIDADKDRNRAFFKNIGEFTRSLEMDVPAQQQQRFMAKLGQGFASLPQSLIPGAIALQVYGDSFDQGIARGLSEDKAANYAKTQALIQEGTERLGGHVLGKIFKSSANIGIRMLKAGASEGIQEFTQEGAAMMIEKVFGVEKGTPEYSRLWDAFGIGALTGAGATVAASPFVKSEVQKSRDVLKSTIEEDLLEAVYEGDVRKVLKLQKEKQKLAEEEQQEIAQGEKAEQDAVAEQQKAEQDAVAEQQKAAEEAAEPTEFDKALGTVGEDFQKMREAEFDEKVKELSAEIRGLTTEPEAEIEGLTTEPEAEIEAKPEEKTPATKLPFDKTEDAVAFAEKATPEQMAGILTLEKELGTEVKKRIDAKKIDDEVVSLATQAQLAREARESYEVKTPKVAVKPKAEPKIEKPPEDVLEQVSTVKSKTIKKTVAKPESKAEVKAKPVVAPKVEPETVIKPVAKKIEKPVEKPTEDIPEQVSTVKSKTIKKTVAKAVDTDYTTMSSARQASIAEDRKAMGLDAINSPDRKSWETSLKEAKEGNMPAKAHRLAAEVITNPRTLEVTETAGLVIRLAELKNEYKSATQELQSTTDKADIITKAAEAERIESEFNLLSEAVHLNGSKAGRTLVAQKLTINKDFDLVSVLNRAKVAAKKDLKPEQRRKFETLTKKLDAANTKVEELTKTVQEAKAQNIFTVETRKMKNVKSRTRAQADTDLTSLVAKANALIKAGCNN